jgi:hypothetical protein
VSSKSGRSQEIRAHIRSTSSDSTHQFLVDSTTISSTTVRDYSSLLGSGESPGERPMPIFERSLIPQMQRRWKIYARHVPNRARQESWHDPIRRLPTRSRWNRAHNRRPRTPRRRRQRRPRCHSDTQGRLTRGRRPAPREVDAYGAGAESRPSQALLTESTDVPVITRTPAL